MKIEREKKGRERERERGEGAEEKQTTFQLVVDT